MAFFFQHFADFRNRKKRMYAVAFAFQHFLSALLAVKNHYNGARNPIAQFKSEITVDTVLRSSLVADPLRRDSLLSAVDKVKDKYGDSSLTFAVRR